MKTPLVVSDFCSHGSISPTSVSHPHPTTTQRVRSSEGTSARTSQLDSTFPVRLNSLTLFLFVFITRSPPSTIGFEAAVSVLPFRRFTGHGRKTQTSPLENIVTTPQKKQTGVNVSQTGLA